MELLLIVYILGIIASITAGIMMLVMSFTDDDPMRKRGARMLLCSFIWPVTTLPFFLLSLWRWADISIEDYRKRNG